MLRLLVVGEIMFVGLVSQWPTESPYEILDDGEYTSFRSIRLTAARPFISAAAPP